MTQLLDSDSILAAALLHTKSINIGKLFLIRKALEDRMPGTTVNLSNYSISTAVRNYPQIFQKDEKSIHRAKDAEKFLKSDYLKSVFFQAFKDELIILLYEIVQEQLKIESP